MKKFVLALDQGTTSSRSCIFDKTGKPVSMAQKEYRQIYPKPGWVEHDPYDILNSQLETAKEVVLKAGISFNQIAAIGITNQRETTLVWDKDTGKPVCNAIVWQCRRTTDLCGQLKSDGLSSVIKAKTGLVIDAYFSATKLSWVLDKIPYAKEAAKKGKLLFGTVDSWLLWNLTAGKKHLTDYSNASRTMMYDIKKLTWDKDILKRLDIPEYMLPSVFPSSYPYGYTDPGLFGVSIPICGVAGDQQASLFGQQCFNEGAIKNTYGTGCFLLMNTGTTPVESQKGLITTLCAGEGIQYALEGSIFTAGAVVQWLRDEMKLIRSADESEKMAMSVQDSNGVVLVPAFTGLGAPYWNMNARGTLLGITRGVNANHIVRAALESIAWQSVDVINLMSEEAGIFVPSIKVDGGASSNNFLMQFQADAAGVTVERPFIRETTALGAAYLAGLCEGFYRKSDICAGWTPEAIFKPQRCPGEMEIEYTRWKKAVLKAMDWV